MTNTFRDFQISKNGDDVIFNYRVGLPTYGESLIKGEFRALGFNGIGYNLSPGMMVNSNHDRSNILDIEGKCAFSVEIDGQTLVSFWELIDNFL